MLVRITVHDTTRGCMARRRECCYTLLHLQRLQNRGGCTGRSGWGCWCRWGPTSTSILYRTEDPCTWRRPASPGTLLRSSVAEAIKQQQTTFRGRITRLAVPKGLYQGLVGWRIDAASHKASRLSTSRATPHVRRLVGFPKGAVFPSFRYILEQWALCIQPFCRPGLSQQHKRESMLCLQSTSVLL